MFAFANKNRCTPAWILSTPLDRGKVRASARAAPVVLQAEERAPQGKWLADAVIPSTLDPVRLKEVEGSAIPLPSFLSGNSPALLDAVSRYHIAALTRFTDMEGT